MQRKIHENLTYTDHYHMVSVDFCPHVVIHTNRWPHLGLELAAYTALVMKPLAYPEEEKI